MKKTQWCLKRLCRSLWLKQMRRWILKKEQHEMYILINTYIKMIVLKRQSHRSILFTVLKKCLSIVFSTVRQPGLLCINDRIFCSFIIQDIYYFKYWSIATFLTYHKTTALLGTSWNTARSNIFLLKLKIHCTDILI